MDKIPKDLKLEERAAALLKMVACYAAGKFKKIYDESNGLGDYALDQPTPAICMDSEIMIAHGLRYASWAENISVKTPSIKSALPLVEELASSGIAVCTTLNFPVSQALAVGRDKRHQAEADLCCSAVRSPGRIPARVRERQRNRYRS